MLLAGLALALLSSSADADSRRWVPVSGKSLVAFEASAPDGEFRGSAETVTGSSRRIPPTFARGSRELYACLWRHCAPATPRATGTC